MSPSNTTGIDRDVALVELPVIDPPPVPSAIVVPSVKLLTVICKGSDIEISAERIFMDDIESIISDLQIETAMKDKIFAILDSDLEIKRKRIEIRKLEGKGLERKFIKLFLKLIEYLEMF